MVVGRVGCLWPALTRVFKPFKTVSNPMTTTPIQIKPLSDPSDKPVSVPVITR
jgi:hypothetical protein